jgi:hypothetical protein
METAFLRGIMPGEHSRPHPGIIVVVGRTHQSDVVSGVLKGGEVRENSEVGVPAAHEQKVISHDFIMRESRGVGKRSTQCERKIQKNTDSTSYPGESVHALQ